MEIVNGHAIIAYDFKVNRGQTKCLFNMKETLDEKKAREAERKFDMSAEGAQKLFDNLQKHAEHSVKKMMADIPALELPGDLKNFDHM